MDDPGRPAAFEERLPAFLESQAGWARDTLCRLIGFPSTTGEEAGVQAALAGLLAGCGLEAEVEPIEPSIVDDPDYTPVPDGRGYSGRPNVLARIRGASRGRSVIVNTHTDVVPAPAALFTPEVRGDIVRGRGACDAKGQVVTALLALRAVRELELRPAGGIEAQFVVEEEAGGNGSLAAVAAGRRADAAVVLEPTGLVVCPANRGAAWFRLEVEGRSVHMGRYYDGVSAFDEARRLLALFEEYEAGLRRDSRGAAGFPDEPSPVVVNIGRVRAGDWPSTVPGECLVEGGVAFLPNTTARRIEAEIRTLIETRGSPWAREHARFALAGLRNEAFATPADQPLVGTFAAAAAAVLGPRPAAGWNASCDARLFFHRGGMPTVVFGAGDLRRAHAADEEIDIRETLKAAEVLAGFLARWSGPDGKERGHAG